MDENAKKDGFGSKQIGFFAGVALLFNNITGPAMIDIPVLYQQAGWVTPTLAMIFILLVSTIASSMLVEVMASIPNNDRFQGRVELTTLAYHYFPAWGYWLTQIFLNFSLQALNISSIIVSAQMMDFTLVSLFNFLCAFEFFPHFGYVSVSELGNDTSPFTGVVISLGFLIVLIVTVPLGYFNLDDNMIVQQGAFLLAFAIVIQWIVEFFFIGFDSALVPAFGPDQSQVLGTTIFNYAFVITVPSWINETSGSVSINKALWVGSILSTVVYVVLGVLGGFSLPFSGDQNLLDALTENTSGALNTASLVSVYSFPAIVLLSSIPIYSIIVRYNLLESEFCSKGWANFWGVLFPWMVAVPFCTGSGFNIFVNWSSLLVSGVINFVVPLILYIVMKREQMSGAEGVSRASLVIQREGKDGVMRIESTESEAAKLTEHERNVALDAESFEIDDTLFSAFPFTRSDWWRQGPGQYLPPYWSMYFAMSLAIIIGGVNVLIVIIDVVFLALGEDVVD